MRLISLFAILPLLHLPIIIPSLLISFTGAMVDLPSAAARIAVNFPDMALLPMIEADREAQVEAMKKSGCLISSVT